MKNCVYEGAIEQTVLYGAETWCILSAERIKVNVSIMKCLRSLVGVIRMELGMKREAEELKWKETL